MTKLRHNGSGLVVQVDAKRAEHFTRHGWEEVVAEPEATDETTDQGGDEGGDEQPDEQPDEGSGDEGVSDDAGNSRGRRAVSAKATKRGAANDGD